MKFKRIVRVEITPKKGKPIKIEGLRVKFNVQKTIDIGANSGTIDIYNMATANRAAVAFKYNQFQVLDKALESFGGQIKLFAGYEGNDKLLFSGDMTSATNLRDGGDYLTRINAKTKVEALNLKRINKTYPKGTPYKTIIDYVISQLETGSLRSEATAYLTQIVGKTVLKKGETFFGTATSILQKINLRFQGKISFNVDEAGVNVCGEGISYQVKPKFWYSKFNGLLGSPEITNTGADLKVNLEPDIRVSDLILIDSPSILGIGEPLYVVRQITHSGDSREGEFATSLNTWFYSAAPTIPTASSF